jgi:hypothetical protein
LILEYKNTSTHSKNDRTTRKKVAKCDRHYVRGTIHNLSLSRWTDQEIVDYLREDKKIEIARSTVNSIKNQIEKQAEKWYIELRESRYKYVASYKERIDSLFSYQKKLHEILNVTKKPEIQLRAISELHSIEMSIFSLWKQLPALDIVDTNNDEHNNEEYRYDNAGRNGLPRAISHGPEEDERQDRVIFFGWKQGDPPLDCHFRSMMEEKYGLPNEPWDDPKWIQCPSCNRWLKNTARLEMHAGRYCIPEPIV